MKYLKFQLTNKSNLAIVAIAIHCKFRQYLTTNQSFARFNGLRLIAICHIKVSHDERLLISLI